MVNFMRKSTLSSPTWMIVFWGSTNSNRQTSCACCDCIGCMRSVEPRTGDRSKFRTIFCKRSRKTALHPHRIEECRFQTRVLVFRFSGTQSEIATR